MTEQKYLMEKNYPLEKIGGWKTKTSRIAYENPWLKITHEEVVTPKGTDGIYGVVHFAAFKAVGESVEKPMLYFQNNLSSLMNVLRCLEEFQVNNFVFSSNFL